MYLSISVLVTFQEAFSSPACSRDILTVFHFGRVQVLMFDYDMDGWPDLLTRSFHSTGTAGERVVWRNEKSDMVSFTLINTPFLAPRTLPTSPSSGVFVREKEEEMEQSRSVQREIARESEEEESGDWGEYSIPSSNAFVDMNGDCLADLFLTSFRCKEIVVKSSGKSSSATTLVECEKVVELLLNNKDGLLARGEQPYVHHSEYTMTRLYYTSEMWGKLERGQSLGRDGGAQLSFADVDGDGAMDVIMPVCISSIEGVISNQGDCAVESSIHIIYNSQTMLCGVVTGELNCRKEEDLCSPDPHFTLGSFNGTQSTADVVIIPRALMGDYHLLSRKDMEPLTVRVGDYNLDGFPDILIPLVKEKAVASAPTPNLVRSSVSNQKHVLLSIQEEQRQESFLISQNMSHGLEYAKATGQSAHHGAGSYLDMTPRSPTVDSLLREDEVLEGQIVMTLWRNVPCTDQLCGEEADDRGRRTFVRVLGSEVDALHRVRNPFTAVFFDLDETGSADIIVLSDQLLSHSSKKPMKGSKEEAKDLRATKGRSVAVLYNNLYNDAFFLKALGLSGLCTAWCPGVTRFPDPKPYGVNFPGGVFKFTVTDLLGVKRVSMSSQLAQSSHLSLQLPYTLFGLGRAGNYIELIFYGIPYQASRHWNSWICIIPNSQLVAIPYELGKSTNWQLELYITPSGITVAVLLCMIGSLLLLGLIIYILRWREKLQDEMEKREKAHLFSFDAL